LSIPFKNQEEIFQNHDEVFQNQEEMCEGTSNYEGKMQTLHGSNDIVCEMQVLDDYERDFGDFHITALKPLPNHHQSVQDDKQRLHQRVQNEYADYMR